MKNRFLFLVLLFPLLLISCEEECEQATNCSMDPDPGICQAAFVKYYFDPADGQCKAFTYGGCGDYPFDTLEECEGACNCD